MKTTFISIEALFISEEIACNPYFGALHDQISVSELIWISSPNSKISPSIS